MTPNRERLGAKSHRTQRNGTYLNQTPSKSLCPQVRPATRRANSLYFSATIPADNGPSSRNCGRC
jgi:hypothetical protein